MDNGVAACDDAVHDGHEGDITMSIGDGGTTFIGDGGSGCIGDGGSVGSPEEGVRD